ncbi:hypothetical protein ISF_02040 [Cordyceps fumosorosea ARSEF 2679]|uniref:3CxxC-type domain-containing protein n=1 Tax=Cordyceps fumosorosea (strain ARSEF 2679) TaxID=1081104 RepID=A0A162MW27_CORFA|nr:hypothetical protein ISF_02040 [Cordyceps fumosorosea ARSEF 2679]OAA71489.1 hypothetical protein ISF_02040 [Cordyceps fumosorosea ARSEF 2679]
MTKIRSCSMPSYLHPQVQELLDEEDLYFTFRPPGEKGPYIKEKDTAVMGKFRCGNKKCPNKWGSKRIAITIRLYRNNKYTVVVYHQRCQKCDALAKPELDESYEERVSRWLKIWSGINVPWEYHPKKRTAPHQKSRCEGCKAGHCTEVDN